jgi:hypothetical protein
MLLEEGAQRSGAGHVFMSASLEQKRGYCDKKDYLNSMIPELVFPGNLARLTLPETGRRLKCSMRVAAPTTR